MVIICVIGYQFVVEFFVSGNIIPHFICLLSDLNLSFFRSAKAGFFHEESRANLFEVEPQSGMLINTDNGTPMPQV